MSEPRNPSTPLEIVSCMGNVLDHLADAVTGRERCGYIWVMSELLSQLEAMLKKPPEVNLEIPDGEEPENA